MMLNTKTLNNYTTKIFLLFMSLWFVCFCLGLFIDLDNTPVNNQEKNILHNNQGKSILPNSTSEVFLLLFKNNMSIVLFNSIGFATFGISCFVSIIINGYSFGHLISNAIKIGLPETLLLKNTLPHGIFELFGLWISATAGFHGTLLFEKFLRSKPISEVEICTYLKLIVISLSLTLLSVFIETYYTIAHLL